MFSDSNVSPFQVGEDAKIKAGSAFKFLNKKSSTDHNSYKYFPASQYRFLFCKININHWSVVRITLYVYSYPRLS